MYILHFVMAIIYNIYCGTANVNCQYNFFKIHLYFYLYIIYYEFSHIYPYYFKKIGTTAMQSSRKYQSIILSVNESFAVSE